MILPRLPYNIPFAKGEMVQMGKINYSDSFQDGDLADSRNISARRFPYITTRNAREKLDYSGVSAMTAWNKLITVKGTQVYYDGELVSGSVTEGEKQFAIVNSKCVIWPDKMYLDLNTRTLNGLGASMVSAVSTIFDSGTMTIRCTADQYTRFTTAFHIGDCIEISGCQVNTENNKSVVIRSIRRSISPDSSHIDNLIIVGVDDNAFTIGDEGSRSITIERKIPDLDFICESENRLWGCNSADQTIYVSALGDPYNFYKYEGLSTDSYAVAVGTEGDFTGCCKLGSSVLFWKETVLHKVLGGSPSEYSINSYNIEGLKAGCHKSLQAINEVLIYVGLHGVFAYSGGTPTLISPNFGNREITDAVAGTDGDTYFLCAHEGNDSHLYLYETRRNLWVLEDDLDIVDFARIGKDIYFLDASGDIYKHDSGTEEEDIEWLMVTKPFYETIDGRKIYSKLQMRLELPKKSYLTISARRDGGQWEQVHKIVGKGYDVFTVRFMINRCDKFELKFEGKGPATILGMSRIFTIGSER